MAVKLSALRAGRPLSQGTFLIEAEVLFIELPYIARNLFHDGNIRALKSKESAVARLGHWLFNNTFSITELMIQQ
jgi:hypothetical protein